MVPVPKKPRVPLSAKNARGVLLACHPGKIYSRIVRTKMQHLLPEAAQGRQPGGVKGGSMAVPQIVLDKAGLSGPTRQTLQELLAEDAVEMDEQHRTGTLVALSG